MGDVAEFGDCDIYRRVQEALVIHHNAPLTPTGRLRLARCVVDEFGFSWPASFPMARIDQIMVRQMDPVSAWTLPETGSDHLPVAARVKL